MEKIIAREKRSKFNAFLLELINFYAAPCAEDKDNPGRPKPHSKVLPRGNFDSPILIFEGKPDKQSFLNGKAISGSIAGKIAKKLGKKEEDLFYAYTVPCFTEKITDKDINEFRPLVKKLIWIIRPKYVLSLDKLSDKSLKGIKNIPPIIHLKDLDKVKKELMPEKIKAMRREQAWEILRQLPPIIYLKKGYIEQAGSLPDGNLYPNDLDICMKDEELQQYILDALKSVLKPTTKHLFDFFANKEGASGNRIPLYDLALVKRKTLRVIPGRTSIEDISANFTYPNSQESFKVKEIFKVCDNSVILQPQIKGKRIWLSKSENKIKMWDVNRKPVNLDNVIKQVSQLSRSFLVEGIYRQPTFYVDDILFHQTADIRNLTLHERKGILTKVFTEKYLPNIKVLWWEWHLTEDSLKSALNSRSWNIIKEASSKYNDKAKWYILSGKVIDIPSIWAEKIDKKIKQNDGMKVKFFTKYELLKSGGREYGTAAYQDFENMWETWASGYIKNGISVEQKIDGIRSSIQKHNGKVKIYSEGWIDLTRQLPNIVKDIKSWKIDNFIFEGEIVDFDEKGEPLYRTELDTYLHYPPKRSDKNAKIIYYDILINNNELVTGLDYKERRKIYSEVISSIKSKHALVCPGKIVYNKEDFRKAVIKYSQEVCSEGAFCKVATSKYRQKDMVMWARIKNFKEIKVLTIMKRAVSKGNWAYGIAFKENKEIIPFRTRKTYTEKTAQEEIKKWDIISGLDIKPGDHVIQNTFNTSLDVSLKTVITLRFEEITEFKDDGISYYSVLKPAPIDVSEKGEVASLSIIKKAVKVGTGPFDIPYKK